MCDFPLFSFVLFVLGASLGLFWDFYIKMLVCIKEKVYLCSGNKIKQDNGQKESSKGKRTYKI